MNLTEFLKQELKSRDMSIRALGEYSGIPHTTLYGIIKGVSKPQIDTLEKLAAYFKIPMSDMLEMAGYLPEEGTNEVDYQIRYVARQLNRLPEDLRNILLAQIRAAIEYHEVHDE